MSVTDTKPLLAVSAPRRGYTVGKLLVVSLGKLVLSLFAISLVIFLATSAIPGDSARAIIGKTATDEQVEAFREIHGLDEPLVTQYVDFVTGAIHGDFGISYAADQPVMDVIQPRLERTLVLVVIGWLMATLIAVPLGLATGRRRGHKGDIWTSAITIALGALPEFAIAVVLVLVFGIWLEWLPVESSSAGQVDSPLDALDAYVLPAITVALTIIPYVTRLTRANASETIDEPYVRSAVLRGISGWRLTNKHILPNAAPPVVNVLVLQLVGSIGGITVIETVFGFPGLGQLLVSSVGTRDLPVVQAIAMILGTAFVIMNIVADAVVVLLTPRLRSNRG